MSIKSPRKRYSVFGLSNHWTQRIPQFADRQKVKDLCIYSWLNAWGKFQPGSEPT